MLPLKIGACLTTADIAAHRDWLFDDARDIELQDFFSHAALTTDRADRIAAARAALEGHTGRRGIHGPFDGLGLDNRDPELRPLITARLCTAVETAAAVGARQMVLHSPYDGWFHNNRLCYDGYADRVQQRVHDVLGPVVRRAETEGVTLVIENIEDVDPATRRGLAESFGSDAVRVSIDTGHAQIARRMSGAPPVDYFVRDAGARLAHVHLQDVDGHADRHWPPGEGEVEWPAVFRALADIDAAPHLVLEMRNPDDIPRGFAWLKAHGLAI